MRVDMPVRDEGGPDPGGDPARAHEVEVGGAFAPDLGALPASLAARVAWRPETRTLALSGGASAEEIQALRGCHPGDLAWQMAVDRLGALARPRGAGPGSSRFPSTPWGLLLGQLGTREDEPWRRFMALYRRPIGKSIARALHLLGRREAAPAAELGDEFLSWFFQKRVYENVERLGKGERVHRFRGYLRRCVGTFLREGRRGVASRDIEDVAARGEDLVARAVDEELCRDAIEAELEHLHGADRALHRALLLDMKGATLEEAGRRQGVSVATAHRMRKKARAAFRDGMILRRLRDGCASEEEARREWEELIPVMSRVLEEIGAGLEPG
jgi:hypothetical protein